MEIILSTRNPSKAVQISEMFSGSPFVVRTLADAGIEGEAVEDAMTLEENAMKKALFAHQHAPDRWTMADDTGLFILELGGAPGVHAARWAGDATTEEIMQYTLKRLEGAKDRTAVFRTVVAVVSPEGSEHWFMGEARGKLLEVPRCAPQPKMPYSPLFVPDGEELCWAEMDTAYENTVSHRGKAFAKVRAFLESRL